MEVCFRNWEYGACVTIECKELDIDEIISEW